MEFPTCARAGCDVVIRVKKTTNQKYCSDLCCKIATNERVMQRYYNKRDRKLGTKFHCTQCNAVLSRYNEDEVCASCSTKSKPDSRALVVNLFADVMVT